MKQIIVVIFMLLSLCATAQDKDARRPQVQFAINGVVLQQPSQAMRRFEAGVHSYSVRHERWGNDAMVHVKEVEGVDDESVVWRFLLVGFRDGVQLETVVGATDKPQQRLTQKATDLAYVMYDGKAFKTLGTEQGDALFADYEQAMREVTDAVTLRTPDDFVNTLGGLVAMTLKEEQEMYVKNVSVDLPQPILAHHQHAKRNELQNDFRKWMKTTDFMAPTDELPTLWAALKKYLAWEKQCFDADGDHLYDAFYCWNYGHDTLCYQGGAVTYSSAANYELNRWAAQLAPLMGESAQPYEQEAAAIRQAMNSRLWLVDKGHWAERQDTAGLRRQHEYAALWTVCETIDAEIGTPQQNLLTTRYLDAELPQMMTGGREAQKGLWAALAYMKAGRQEKGYELMQRYARENTDRRLLSRVLLEGLFGIRPQAMQGELCLQPSFPETWDSATVHTPYIDYSFRRLGRVVEYDITQHLEKPMQVIVRLPIGHGQYQEVRGNSNAYQTIRLKTPLKLPEVHWMEAYVAEPAMQHADTIDLQRGKPKVLNLRKLMNGDGIILTSLADNYPDSVSIPVGTYASKALLLMDGTTNVMEMRIANGEVVAHYKDGTQDTLQLVNPTNWKPTGQPLTLCMPLDRQKKLQTIMLRALSNGVLIGLKGITLQ